MWLLGMEEIMETPPASQKHCRLSLGKVLSLAYNMSKVVITRPHWFLDSLLMVSMPDTRLLQWEYSM